LEQFVNDSSLESKSAPAWQPIGPVERRVLGVLVEKAKTTPDTYPLSLNALRTGCNQKNNRDPVMQLTDDEVEESLAKLRPLGAAEEVQGSGRVARFRHHMYEWLGVDKVELAVMAELLLRGAQTEGELRGRAARMEPIADVAALRPILASLRQKGLVVSVTSEGRGHVVDHTLYPAGEAEKLRAQFASHGGPPQSAPSQSSSPVAHDSATVSHRDELAELRSEVAQLQQQLTELAARFERDEQELERLKRALGVSA
jgi:uncharacterized protein